MVEQERLLASNTAYLDDGDNAPNYPPEVEFHIDNITIVYISKHSDTLAGAQVPDSNASIERRANESAQRGVKRQCADTSGELLKTFAGRRRPYFDIAVVVARDDSAALARHK